MALDSLASLGAAARGFPSACSAEGLSPGLSADLSADLSAEPGSFSSGLGKPPPKATGVAAPRFVAGAMAATWLA
ncbi:hypothetical protein D3C73_1194310 [compost metagenome]